VEAKLVRKDEVDFFRDPRMGPSQRLLVMLHMVGDLTRQGLAGQSDKVVVTEIINRILAYREYHQELVDTLELAIPFQYHHLLTAVVSGNLMVLAYGMALTDSCLAPPIFIIMTVMFMGMMDLSAQLWNPFGSDAVDFPVNKWVSECLAGLSAILEYEHDGAKEGWKTELEEEKQVKVQLALKRKEVDDILGVSSRRWAKLDAWQLPLQESMAAGMDVRSAAVPSYTQLAPAEDAMIEADPEAEGGGSARSKGRRPSTSGLMNKQEIRSALQEGRKSSKEAGGGGPKTWSDEMNGTMTFFESKINILLVFVPAGIVATLLHWNAGLVFLFNFLAIVPLAALLGASTEALAVHTGQLIGALLNATFGNAVEMILCVQAVRRGLILVVQGNLLGSVLSNLLLVLGMALFGAGLKFKEMKFNASGAQANMVCQVVASIAIVLPMLFHDASHGSATSQEDTLTISRYSALFLMMTYGAFLWFQLISHAEMFQDGEESNEEAVVGRMTAGIFLSAVTMIVAVCSEGLVDSIEEVSEQYGIPHSFIGIILLPIVGNAAEHATAVTCAMRGMLDLALGVAVGSSTQVSLFVVPVSVLAGWACNQPMTLAFRKFDTACYILTIFLVMTVLSSGSTNWLHGMMLMTTYCLIAVSVWYIPDGN